MKRLLRQCAIQSEYSSFALLAASTFFIFATSCVNADIVLFNNLNAFQASTNASSATGPLPNLGAIPGQSSGVVTVGSLTFSIPAPSTRLHVGGIGVTGVSDGDWYPQLTGHEIAISGPENLNVDLDPVFAFGFVFIEPDITMPVPYGNSGNNFGVDSTFSVSLIDDSILIENFTFNAPDDIISFIGVKSDIAFSRVEIRELTGSIDDEYFGEFYTYVPEPSSALIVVGITILLGLRMPRDV